jgi:hypothetical protein
VRRRTWQEPPAFSLVERRQFVRETLELLKENLLHTTEIARQTLDVVLADSRPSTQRYRLILKKLESLKKAQALQRRTDLSGLRTTHYSEKQVVAFLDSMAEEHHVIERQLSDLLSVPWPRSPQAGLHSLQQQVFELLTELLQQTDRELSEIVSLIRRDFLSNQYDVKTLNDHDSVQNSGHVR